MRQPLAHRAAASSVGVILALAGLVACTTASQVSDPNCTGDECQLSGGFMSVEGAMAEYDLATKEFELPEGGSWPEAEQVFGMYLNSEDSHRFETGFGWGEAGTIWLCAWQGEVLDAHGAGETARTDAALEQVAAAPSQSALWNTYDDSSQEWFNKELEAAQLGDFSMLENDVRLNCVSEYESQ
jgi:hypothetical protein